MPRSSKPKSASSSTSTSQGKAFRPKSKKGWIRPLRWLGYLVAGFFLSTLFAALFFRFVPPPLTPLMAIRGAGYAIHGTSPVLDKDWKSLENISPRLVEAVVASEDQRFFEHNGFDWGAIVSAIGENERGKRKLGASTISQQTAKNLFLWPDRSWVRKGLEAYFTFLIEILWSKHRILEVYLNIIEMGSGTYGAEAAAQRWFHVSAARLTGPQAALIAAILPNPRKWSPANPTGYLQRRQTWILRQMDHLGPLPEGLSEGGPRSVPGASTAIRIRRSGLGTDSGAILDPTGGPGSERLPETGPPPTDTFPLEPTSPELSVPDPEGASPAPDSDLPAPRAPADKPYPDADIEPAPPDTLAP
jgi:monofunctional biosynthetic peptidoglycan transglycosylase